MMDAVWVVLAALSIPLLAVAGYILGLVLARTTYVVLKKTWLLGVIERVHAWALRDLD